MKFAKLHKVKLYFSVFLFLNLTLKAQYLGGRSSGMAYTSITLADVWAVSNNIAASAQMDKSNVGIHYDNRFFQSSFNTLALAYVQPTYSFGNTSLLVQRLGNEHFNRTQIAIGYAHKIEWISLGLQVEYVQSYVSEFGAKNNFILNFGGKARITQTLSMGAIIKNINQAKLQNYQDERLPTVMSIGISYKPYEKLLLNAQIEKDVERKPTFRIGTEYEIINNFKVRTGVSISSFFAHFGIGYSYLGFEFNYAALYHAQLGFSNTFSLNYAFGKTKNNNESKNTLIP